MRDLYIRNGQGFVIVYSIISEDTFNQLHRIYNQFMTIKVRFYSFIHLNICISKQKEQPALVLVGNKLDLANEQRIVQREKGQQLADQWMCPFYETSAKDSINVDQVNIKLYFIEDNISFFVSFQIFLDLVRQIDRRLPCVRKASRQDDMPTLPINFPMKNYFCCPFFSRNKSRQNKSTSQKQAMLVKSFKIISLFFSSLFLWNII